MPSHKKNDPSCHCAVCHDGSRMDSTSTSLTHGPSIRTAGSAMTLNSECLSGRGSPSRATVATDYGAATAGRGEGRPGGAAAAAGRSAAGPQGYGPAGPGSGSGSTGGGPGGAAAQKARKRPTGAGVARRSALADKYMYTDVDYEPPAEPEPELEPGPDVDIDVDAAVDLICDDSDLHKVEGRTVPYFPQPEDDAHPAQPCPMEPVGPWAQGRPDWGPLAGMTGTRPVVDRYSITRYSPAEWRKKNLDTFQRAAGDNHNAGMVDFNSRACMQHVAAEADKNQADCTARLEQRAMDLHRWLTEVRKAYEALWAEIQTLEAYRARLRRLLCVLAKCGHVAGECLELRAKRCDPDLVRDEPEEQLVKEVALIKEVRGLMKRCLLQVEEQQQINKAAKARLCTNWSDKKEAYALDSLNAGLRTADPTAVFREGATRFPDSQSTI